MKSATFSVSGLNFLSKKESNTEVKIESSQTLPSHRS